MVGGGSGAVLAVLLFAQTPPVNDYFDPPGAPVELRSTLPDGTPIRVAPGHATLLPDGRVMFVGPSWLGLTGSNAGPTFVGTFTPTPVYEPAPAVITLTKDAVPLDIPQWMDFPDGFSAEDSLFCAGQTLTADGKFFTAGGSRVVIDREPENPDYYLYFLGLGYSMTFDPYTSGWARIAANMKGKGDWFDPVRWYPTATRLKDGDILVSSGSDVVFIADMNWEYTTYLWPNKSVESYDAATGQWTELSTNAASPMEIWASDYTHVFQLPGDAQAGGFDVLMFGEPGLPTLFSPNGTTKWDVRHESPRPDAAPGSNPNYSATSAFLPFRLVNGEWGYANGAVTVTGGPHGTSHEHYVDVYDPVTNAWRPRGAGNDMQVHRHIPMTIGLPDSRLAILGGMSCGCSGGDVGRTSYLDPRGGAFSLAQGVADMPEIRGYHGVSLLLPDGRLLVAGGRTHGHELPTDEQPTMRYLYPDYMFDEERPYLVWAEPVVTLGGGSFGAYWFGRPAAEAVLIGLGSMTHAFDANQRTIQIPIHGQIIDPNPPNGRYAALGTPANAAIAPPGHYMLFLIDDQGSVSPAQIIKVE